VSLTHKPSFSVDGLSQLSSSHPDSNLAPSQVTEDLARYPMVVFPPVPAVASKKLPARDEVRIRGLAALQKVVNGAHQALPLEPLKPDEPLPSHGFTPFLKERPSLPNLGRRRLVTVAPPRWRALLEHGLESRGCRSATTGD
jgi:hypothetical protein